MNRMRTTFLLIALLMAVVTAPALAQSQTASQSSDKAANAISTKIEDISNWNKKQWYAAKAKWVKEKAKWADCQKRAAERNLSGRKSWPFFYGCMMKGS